MTNPEVVFVLGSTDGFGPTIQMTSPNQALERNDHEPSFFDGFGGCDSRLFSLVVVAHL